MVMLGGWGEGSVDRGHVTKEKQEIKPLLFVLTGTYTGFDMQLQEGIFFVKRIKRPGNLIC